MAIDNQGGCLMQWKWDYADSGISGKWSTTHNVYRLLHLVPADPGGISTGYDTGREVVVTKNKIRGRGRALKLRFSADADKDFVLLGWATTLNGGGAE